MPYQPQTSDITPDSINLYEIGNLERVENMCRTNHIFSEIQFIDPFTHRTLWTLGKLILKPQAHTDTINIPEPKNKDAVNKILYIVVKGPVYLFLEKTPVFIESKKMVAVMHGKEHWFVNQSTKDDVMIMMHYAGKITFSTNLPKEEKINKIEDIKIVTEDAQL
jgi:hypothetical protein